jgi:hypothetical protein
MLNCGPYHTVCNIKKQRDHTGPDGQCHKDSKQSSVAFRAKCKIFSRHLQKPILKKEKGRFKGL